MHIEIDRVLVRLTETTLRELVKEIDSLKVKKPLKKTALFKSDYHTMRFLVDLVTVDRPQETLNYKAVMPERNGNAPRNIPRPSSG
jgi:hypothetical protein